MVTYLENPTNIELVKAAANHDTIYVKKTQDHGSLGTSWREYKFDSEDILDHLVAPYAVNDNIGEVIDKSW